MAKSGPTLRAQWLGQQLREAREAAKLTLKDASEYLLRDTGTISRFENGRVPPRPGDVGALLNLYGVDDPAKRQALDQLSRDVWIKGWWDGYTGHVSRNFIDYAWLENRAHSIRSFDSNTLPGLVQTRDFARAVIQAADPDAPQERIESWLDFRMRRQHVLEGDDPPKLSVLLDEALLLRPIGGPSVMRDQLLHLLDIATRPKMTIRVLPLKEGAHAAHTGAFKIFELPEPYTEVAYAETLAGSIYVESDAVDRFVRSYDRLLKAALPPKRSAAMIEATAKDLQ